MTWILLKAVVSCTEWGLCIASQGARAFVSPSSEFVCVCRRQGTFLCVISYQRGGAHLRFRGNGVIGVRLTGEVLLKVASQQGDSNLSSDANIPKRNLVCCPKLTFAKDAIVNTMAGRRGNAGGENCRDEAKRGVRQHSNAY